MVTLAFCSELPGYRIVHNIVFPFCAYSTSTNLFMDGFLFPLTSVFTRFYHMIQNSKWIYVKLCWRWRISNLKAGSLVISYLKAGYLVISYLKGKCSMLYCQPTWHWCEILGNW